MNQTESHRTIAANTVLFRHFPLEEALAHAKRAGYQGVEFAAIKGMCEHLELDHWVEQVPELHRLLTARHLVPVSIEVGKLDPARLRPGLQAAAALGIPVVNVGPGGKSKEPGSLEAAIEALEAGAAWAAEAGVTLCVKAHVGAAMYDTPTTLRVLKAVPNPALGVDLDPSHLHRAGEDPADSYRAVANRVRHVHIRDCPQRSGGPGPITEQACGRGQIDLISFCSALVQGGYEGPVCLEVIGATPEDPLTDLVTIAAETAGYLRAAFDAAPRLADASIPLGGAR